MTSQTRSRKIAFHSKRSFPIWPNSLVGNYVELSNGCSKLSQLLLNYIYKKSIDSSIVFPINNCGRPMYLHNFTRQHVAIEVVSCHTKVSIQPSNNLHGCRICTFIYQAFKLHIGITFTISILTTYFALTIFSWIFFFNYILILLT